MPRRAVGARCARAPCRSRRCPPWVIHALVPVMHPVVAVAHRLGAQRGGVGARGGLGEAVRAEQAAAEHRRQMRGLLLLGAVAGERVAGQRMDADAEADGEPGRGELLEDLEVDLVRLVAAATVPGTAVRAGRISRAA